MIKKSEFVRGTLASEGKFNKEEILHPIDLSVFPWVCTVICREKQCAHRYTNRHFAGPVWWACAASFQNFPI